MVWGGSVSGFRTVATQASPEIDIGGRLRHLRMLHGLSQRELPVAGFDAEMQGTVLNISNIVPRMRFGTEDTPVVSANWAGYRIVATGASGALQADTVSTGVQLDCATIGQVASVAVSQLNRLTGAGPAVTKEIQ